MGLKLGSVLSSGPTGQPFVEPGPFGPGNTATQKFLKAQRAGHSFFTQSPRLQSRVRGIVGRRIGPVVADATNQWFHHMREIERPARWAYGLLFGGPVSRPEGAGLDERMALWAGRGYSNYSLSAKWFRSGWPNGPLPELRHVRSLTFAARRFLLINNTQSARCGPGKNAFVRDLYAA